MTKIDGSPIDNHRVSFPILRILDSLRWISGHRFGVSLEELRRFSRDNYGVGLRTVQRDLSTLRALNAIEFELISGVGKYFAKDGDRLVQLLRGDE